MNKLSSNILIYVLDKGDQVINISAIRFTLIFRYDIIQ